MRRLWTASKLFAGVALGWVALTTAVSWMTPFDEAQIASADATAPSAPSASAPPSAAPPRPEAPQPPGHRDRDDDAALRQHADAVASYTMRVSLDPDKHDLRGEATIVWRNVSSAPQGQVFVHLYLNAFKNDDADFSRQPAAGFRGGGRIADYGHIEVERFSMREGGDDLWPRAERAAEAAPAGQGSAPAESRSDETDMRVPLPHEVAPGASATFDVRWHAHLPSVVMRTGHAGRFHMVAQWFPKLARLEPDGRWAHFPFERYSEFYADFGSYDVTIDVPAGYVVGATGALSDTKSASGRTELRYRQDDVHDFAFAAWDAFREQTATTEDGIAVRCLYPPGYDRDASVELDTALYGLRYFGGAYGRYPYRTLTIVHPPPDAGEAGGMEYPTLIATGGGWYEALLPARLIELVTIHELGHQWFYGLVATNEHAYPFLDEGMNSYAEVDALERRFPGRSAGSFAGFDVGLAALHRYQALLADQNAPVAQPAGAFATGGDYAFLVYSRTATIMLTLARVYGEDLVRSAVGRYARRQRFEHPGPEELLGVIGEVIGPEAAGAARTALFDEGWVDYAIADLRSHASAPPGGIFGDPSHPSPTPTALHPGQWEGSVLVRRRGTLRFPVDVDLIAADGSVQRVRWPATSQSARLDYVGSSPLVAATIDPEQRVLLDRDLTNNAVAFERPRLSAAMLERGTFLAELLALMGVP